jgi:phosphoribosyl 1,2-cyclic phosphodiesterase
MLKISTLATSSAGNCSFVSDGTTRILIDAGLCLAETFQRLRSINEDPDTIDAVLLTHPHGDHSDGLAVMLRYWRRAGGVVPVYCSQATYDALPNAIPPPWFRPVGQLSYWSVGCLECETFAVEHDTGEPLGFTVTSGSYRASFALDLGTIPPALGQHLAGSDFLLLEANHDPDMLRAGPYSHKLKERIARTHLSNEAACRWIEEYMNARTKHLWLGHLSMTTNDHEIVRLMAAQAIAHRKLEPELEVIWPAALQPSRVVLEPSRDPDKEL